MGITGGHTVPTVRAYNSAALSILDNGAFQALTLDSERWDTDAMHSTSSNTSRLTCVTPGVYDIVGHAEFASNATGARVLRVLLNGATPIAVQTNPALSGNVHRLSVAAQYRLAAGDYVELQAFQNSGGALNVNASANHSPEFGMTWLGYGT